MGGAELSGYEDKTRSGYEDKTRSGADMGIKRGFGVKKANSAMKRINTLIIHKNLNNIRSVTSKTGNLVFNIYRIG